MADIDTILRDFAIRDPVTAARVRAAATALQGLDADTRERTIARTIISNDLVERTAAIYGLELQEDERAAAPPPIPATIDPEVQAAFDRIDAAFAPKKSNPEAKE